LKIFLVGGAVRDELLGLPIKERDWVVVGSTPEEMESLGYQAVGKDFPVFLHPQTHEEYALARTERKTARGYKGFIIHADPDVTLEEDLKRRDLTINAIAKDEQGQLIDPYNGQADLKAKRFRHVSNAFSEDPVRILRLARFAAKLPEFKVDPKTESLLYDMVTNGEVDALVAERVWQELRRALDEKAPQRFFEVLKDCDALQILFPVLTNSIPNINYPQLSTEQRFALLLSNTTLKSIKALCSSYRVPTDFKELAVATRQLSDPYLNLDINEPSSLLDFLKLSDAQRREQRFIHIVELLTLLHATNHLPSLKAALHAIKNIDTRTLITQQLTGADFAKALKALQLEALAKK
jgi:tRNA nucleotidyltransferase (CCA-adding enzyme)